MLDFSPVKLFMWILQNDLILQLHYAVAVTTIVYVWYFSSENHQRNRFLDILGYPSILFCAAFSFWILDNESNSNGSNLGWYGILSVVTSGIVPALTLSFFGIAGRFIAKKL